MFKVNNDDTRATSLTPNGTFLVDQKASLIKISTYIFSIMVFFHRHPRFTKQLGK